MGWNFLRCLLLFFFPLFIIGCRKDDDKIITPIIPITNASIENQAPVLKKVTLQINNAIGGYYGGIPYHYDQTTKSYPLLIFLHGLGQMGNGSTELDYLGIDGIGKFIVEKKLSPNFSVNGQNYSFIILSPQYSKQPTPEEVISFMEHAKQTYRIDTTRIYLSGLSIGGVVTTEVAAKYPDKIAAIAPIAGVMKGNIKTKCSKIAKGNLPVWAFHNEKDPMIKPSDSKEFVTIVNSYAPTIAAKLTIFPNYGHDAWTEALDFKNRENGLNIYEWMLQYSRK